MHNLATHEISPGFLKGFINDDLIIELVKTYIDFFKANGWDNQRRLQEGRI